MKQKPSTRAKLRSLAAKKGWEKRRMRKYILENTVSPLGMPYTPMKVPLGVTLAQALASSLNSKNLEPVIAEDPNPWPAIKAWVKRVLRIGK